VFAALEDSDSNPETENEPMEEASEGELDAKASARAVLKNRKEASELKLQLARAKLKAQEAKAKADKDATEKDQDGASTTVFSPEEAAAFCAAVQERADNGLQPTPDILTLKRLKKALSTDKTTDLIKAPLHGSILSRLGSGNWYSTRNMSAKDAYGEEKIQSLHNYLPVSKNLIVSGRVTMGRDKSLEISSKREPTKSLRFTTKTQVVSAIFRRMNAMLRNPVPSSLGYVRKEERGPFMEYCTFLNHMLYVTAIGGVVEFDRMLMQARQDGEWLNFGPIPQRIERTTWPKATPPTCAFCEAPGHLFDMCEHRESEQDIPREYSRVHTVHQLNSVPLSTRHAPAAPLQKTKSKK
jgi:hypothetical protein